MSELLGVLLHIRLDRALECRAADSTDTALFHLIALAVIAQRRFLFVRGTEASLLSNVTDAIIEAFPYAVNFRGRDDQPVPNAELLAQSVKRTRTAGLLRFCHQP